MHQCDSRTCFSGNHGNAMHVWVVLKQLFDDSNDVCEGFPGWVRRVQKVEGFFEEQGHLSFIFRLWIGWEWVQKLESESMKVKMNVRLGV